MPRATEHVCSSCLGWVWPQCTHTRLIHHPVVCCNTSCLMVKPGHAPLAASKGGLRSFRAACLYTTPLHRSQPCPHLVQVAGCERYTRHSLPIPFAEERGWLWACVEEEAPLQQELWQEGEDEAEHLTGGECQPPKTSSMSGLQVDFWRSCAVCICLWYAAFGCSNHTRMDRQAQLHHKES